MGYLFTYSTRSYRWTLSTTYLACAWIIKMKTTSMPSGSFWLTDMYTGQWWPCISSLSDISVFRRAELQWWNSRYQLIGVTHVFYIRVQVRGPGSLEPVTAGLCFCIRLILLENSSFYTVTMSTTLSCGNFIKFHLILIWIP